MSKPDDRQQQIDQLTAQLKATREVASTQAKRLSEQKASADSSARLNAAEDLLTRLVTFVVLSHAKGAEGIMQEVNEYFAKGAK